MCIRDRSEAASSADASEWSDVASATSSEYHHLDEKVRGMIFVRTLDLSKALLIWMKRHPKLKWLNPGRITGINASVKDGGESVGWRWRTSWLGVCVCVCVYVCVCVRVCACVCVCVTYLTASPCYSTNTSKHGYTTNRYYKYE